MKIAFDWDIFHLKGVPLINLWHSLKIALSQNVSNGIWLFFINISSILKTSLGRPWQQKCEFKFNIARSQRQSSLSSSKYRISASTKLRTHSGIDISFYEHLQHTCKLEPSMMDCPVSIIIVIIILIILLLLLLLLIILVCFILYGQWLSGAFLEAASQMLFITTLVAASSCWSRFCLFYLPPAACQAGQSWNIGREI